MPALLDSQCLPMENFGGGHPFDQQQPYGGYHRSNTSPGSSSAASIAGKARYQSQYQQAISHYEDAGASAIFDPLHGLSGGSQAAGSTSMPSRTHHFAATSQPYHLPFVGFEPNPEGVVVGSSTPSAALSDFPAPECPEFLTSEAGGMHAAALLAYTSYRTRQAPPTHKHPDAGEGWLVPEPRGFLRSSGMPASVGVALSKSSPPTPTSSSVAPIIAPSIDSADNSTSGPPPAVRDDKDDKLSNFKMDVPGVSLEPMTGTQIIDTTHVRMDEVVTRYLPCVDFLVQCQQDLRAGLALATKKKLVGRVYRDALSPSQFYYRYLAQLPNFFLKKNEPIMAPDKLKDSYSGIESLCADAKAAEHSGCEAVKNAFLGGMRDGESWGLRRWLSKNGGALKICNDLELILHAMRKLDKQCDMTRRLGELIRPRAQQAFDRLKNDVPHAYQEVSSAHPYLPFFHRLENALSGLSNFDPDDDDVIELLDDDDDDIQEVEPPPKRQKVSNKPNAGPFAGGDSRGLDEIDKAFMAPRTKFPRIPRNEVENRRCEEGDDSDIEVLCVKPAPVEDDDEAPETTIAGSVPLSLSKEHEEPLSESNQDFEVANQGTQEKRFQAGWRCSQCTYLNPACSEKCEMCDDDDENDTNAGGVKRPQSATDGLEESRHISEKSATHNEDDTRKKYLTLQLCEPEEEQQKAAEMQQIVGELERIARSVDNEGSPVVQDPTDYWNQEGRYTFCLRLFARVLQRRGARRFLDPVDETELFMAGKIPYSSVIRHPLCFKDILEALHSQGGDRLVTPSGEEFARKRGQLKVATLRQWNMFNGRDMLQAIDLVFLNALSYNGKQKTLIRYETNKLRKVLWDGIKGKVDLRSNMPIKRGEKSGFIVVKPGLAGS